LVSGIKITFEDFEYHHNKCWVHPIEMVTCTISTQTLVSYLHDKFNFKHSSICMVVECAFVGWKIFGVFWCVQFGTLMWNEYSN
jgi:hypothetical protein